jgi:hypothetical protein
LWKAVEIDETFYYLSTNLVVYTYNINNKMTLIKTNLLQDQHELASQNIRTQTLRFKSLKFHA